MLTYSPNGNAIVNLDNISKVEVYQYVEQDKPINWKLVFYGVACTEHGTPVRVHVSEFGEDERAARRELSHVSNLMRRDS